ncbi:MAG TPA: hypothetical protein VFG33_01445 [Kribbella sp.]|uniref:hypothetical protein n=1 Tax=Kribbella sp. TaxID=1871183 RepID=UPI002D77C1D6|nr:hypothetical protein [Kribbella sp.]HET6291997.1 hypothetical protein [Kribbella sp.]
MYDIQILPERVTTVSPADVESALLTQYSALVRLAYLILPPSLGRHRRILAAHGVVQRALPASGVGSASTQRRLERQLAGETDAGDFVRRRVVQGAVKQAHGRTPVRLLPQVWGIRLFPDSGAADDLALDQALSSLSPEARAAWALVRAEHLPVGVAELQLRVMGVQHPKAAIAEAAAIDENPAGGPPLDAFVFDPCSVRLAPTDLMRRKARGRAVTITVTALLAVLILVSLLATAG